MGDAELAAGLATRDRHPIFAAAITGLILKTTFLVREIRRNDQKDAFISAVTHKLKTPAAARRLPVTASGG